MIKKILLSVLLAFFITACATKTKETADTSGSGSSSSSSSVSSSDSDEGTLTEPEGTGSEKTMGLINSVPGIAIISMSLFGGVLADRFERWRLYLFQRICHGYNRKRQSIIHTN